VVLVGVVPSSVVAAFLQHDTLVRDAVGRATVIDDGLPDRVSGMNDQGAVSADHGGWKPLLASTGPIPIRVIFRGMALITILGGLGGVGTWLYYSTKESVAPREGFSHFFYTYGHVAALVGAFLVLPWVVYTWLLASGALPLLWVRTSDRGVEVASPLGRAGLRSRILVLSSQVEVRLFHDGVNPGIRVVDLQSRGKVLRVRCFGPIAKAHTADCSASLRAQGIKVSQTNELTDL